MLYNLVFKSLSSFFLVFVISSVSSARVCSITVLGKPFIVLQALEYANDSFDYKERDLKLLNYAKMNSDQFSVRDIVRLSKAAGTRYFKSAILSDYAEGGLMSLSAQDIIKLVRAVPGGGSTQVAILEAYLKLRKSDMQGKEVGVLEKALKKYKAKSRSLAL